MLFISFSRLSEFMFLEFLETSDGFKLLESAEVLKLLEFSVVLEFLESSEVLVLKVESSLGFSTKGVEGMHLKN